MRVCKVCDRTDEEISFQQSDVCNPCRIRAWRARGQFVLDPFPLDEFMTIEDGRKLLSPETRAALGMREGSSV